MATAPTSSAYEAGGGGGAGGKFATRSSRRSRATPYDRPPTALRNPSWLSKLVVDPASKLIASGAQRFFSSVFRKRLPPPPPPPPESTQELSDVLADPVLRNQDEAPEAAHANSQNLTSAESCGISELEQLLKHKTFTKSEIDRLTELLRSKAVDLPVENNAKSTEGNLSKLVANFENHQQFRKSPFVENRTERERSHGVISPPTSSARVLEDDIASPAELAKAYMGSRPSKVSPSMLGLRSQAIREETTLLKNLPFTPKSPMMSLETTTGHIWVRENGFPTPRTRGKSAIYNMARTPYSKVRPTTYGKASGPSGYLLPSSAIQDQGGELGSRKMASKRSSSELDGDIGSVGPVRRTRPKLNLSSQKLALPTCGIGDPGSVQQPLSLAQKLPLMDGWRGSRLRGNGDNDTPSTSYAHVPPKSSETAAKILQHLEKLTPKEKSAESKLIAVRDKSPAKLTTDMLHGQALKSLENADSSKLLQSIQDTQKLEDQSHSSLAGANDFMSQNQERTEGNGAKKSYLHEISTSPVKTSTTALARQQNLLTAEASNSATISVVQSPQKKRAFMMSAHEDSLELDDDMHSNGPISGSVVRGRSKPEPSVNDQDSASDEQLVQDKPPAFLEMKKTSTEPIFGKITDLENGSVTIAAGEKTGFAFPALHVSSSTSQTATHPLSFSAFEKPKQSVNETTSIYNSSSPSVMEHSGPQPSYWVQPKQSSISSVGGTDLPLQVPGSNKGDDNNPQDTAKTTGQPEIFHSVAINSTTSNGNSSFVFPENTSLKNGPLTISAPTISSSPSPVSTGFANQKLADSTANLASSTNILTSATGICNSATSGSTFGSTSTTAFAAVPIIQSGSLANPSTAVSSISAASDAETSLMKTKMEKEATIGSVTNSTLGATSFTMASTGSSNFGLSSVSSSAKSVSQGTGSGYVFDVQSSGVESGASTVLQSVPFQFGSSVASPFVSGTSFGLDSSTSLSETKAVGSGSGASSSIFGFSTSASGATSSEAKAVNSSGSGPPGMFSFSASSSATSSVTNAVNSSSGVTPGIFGFGASSSLGNNFASSSFGTSSGIFGASTLSPSPETNAASSSSSASTILGSSWQTPQSSPFSATFNSSPSTGFSFGSASSSFTSAAPIVFGSSTGASSGPNFSFTTATGTTSSSPSLFPTQPTFGNTSTFTVTGSNDQMNTEDMAEDPVQSSTSVATIFGQQPAAPSPSGFGFGSAAPPATSLYQFGGQQNQGALQNSPFQASGSLEFNAGGGSFSLGSGDKSGRKIVKVNRNRHRKRNP